MNNQIICHNEFTVVGRIVDVMKKKDELEVLLLCPNDDNYNLDANKVFIKFDLLDFNKFKEAIGCAIAVTGHIEFDIEAKLIAEMYQIIV